MSLVLDIKKRYPRFMLDMQLEAGEERVALLGASGCGKSCTLRCIAGVATPQRAKSSLSAIWAFSVWLILLTAIPRASREVSNNAWRWPAWWRRIRAFLCSTSP